MINKSSRVNADDRSLLAKARAARTILADTGLKDCWGRAATFPKGETLEMWLARVLNKVAV